MANMMSLSAPELRLQGLLLVIVWFCLAFRSAAGLISASRNDKESIISIDSVAVTCCGRSCVTQLPRPGRLVP